MVTCFLFCKICQATTAESLLSSALTITIYWSWCTQHVEKYSICIIRKMKSTQMGCCILLWFAVEVLLPWMRFDCYVLCNILQSNVLLMQSVVLTCLVTLQFQKHFGCQTVSVVFSVAQVLIWTVIQHLFESKFFKKRKFLTASTQFQVSLKCRTAHLGCLQSVDRRELWQLSLTAFISRTSGDRRNVTRMMNS